MPALSKSPEDRTGHHALPTNLTPITASLDIPAPPRGMSIKLRRQWDQLWRSMVAQLLDRATDGPIIARLFELYALGERLADTLARDQRSERAVERAMRSAAADGDADAMLTAAEAIKTIRASCNSTVGARVGVAREVRMLEAQLGLSPRSRLALGVMLLAGRKAMAEATADAEDDDDY